MNILEICESRYSVRAYLSKAVEKEKIDYILRCAQLAPSAANNQPWIFFVVTNDSVITGIQKSYNREWFKTAPMYIVACKDNSISWKRLNSDSKDYGDVDVSIAAEHICLAAHEKGLGTCWVCNFDPQILSNSLELIDSNLEPVVIFPIGYIDEQKSKISSKIRKDISDIVRWI